MESIDLRNQVLSTRIVNILSKPFSQLKVSLSSWLIVFVAESLAVMLHVGAWKLVYPQAKFDWVAFGWVYWGALIAGIIVVLVEHNWSYPVSVET